MKFWKHSLRKLLVCYNQCYYEEISQSRIINIIAKQFVPQWLLQGFVLLRISWQNVSCSGKWKWRCPERVRNTEHSLSMTPNATVNKPQRTAHVTEENRNLKQTTPSSLLISQYQTRPTKRNNQTINMTQNVKKKKKEKEKKNATESSHKIHKGRTPEAIYTQSE